MSTGLHVMVLQDNTIEILNVVYRGSCDNERFGKSSTCKQKDGSDT
jgi:hypothetical protein